MNEIKITSQQKTCGQIWKQKKERKKEGKRANNIKQALTLH